MFQHFTIIIVYYHSNILYFCRMFVLGIEYLAEPRFEHVLRGNVKGFTPPDAR